MITSQRALSGICAALLLGVTPNLAAAEKTRAIRCTEFDSSMIQSKQVNGVKAYIFTLVVKPASGTLKRCTPEIPPLNICALSEVDGAGKNRGCEVSWTQSIVDSGRWTLNVRNDSSAAFDLQCSMICY